MNKNSIYIGTYCFNTLVAISSDEKAQGLMFKRWPPPIMAFPFSKPAVRKFWMKNTISPLDIVFCCNGSIIDIHRGEPLSEKLVGPNSPIDLVVEFPAGMIGQIGVAPGDPIKLSYDVETLSKKIALSIDNY